MLIYNINIGDKLYWNLNDFDMPKPKSIPLKVIGKQTGCVLGVTKDNVKVLIYQDDLDNKVYTDKPLYKTGQLER